MLLQSFTFRSRSDFFCLPRGSLLLAAAPSVSSEQTEETELLETNFQQQSTECNTSERVTCAIGRITPGCRVRIIWLKVIRLLVVVGLIRGPEPLQAKPSQVTSFTAAERRFPERALRISIYFVRPHEANEENDGKSNGEDVDGPEPRPLQGGHIEALDETMLQ